MSKALIILILFVIAVSGCIKNLSDTNIVDVQKNPEEFVNKDISVNGKYTLFLFSDGEYLIDEQGYKIKIDCKNSGRVFELENEYKVEGIFTSKEKCSCQYRYVLNVTEEDWKQIVSLYPQANKQNVSVISPIFLIPLFMPTAEEGWDKNSLQKIEKYECTKDSKFNVTEGIFDVKINQTHIAAFKTEVSKEERCEPNSIERDYYLKCS